MGEKLQPRSEISMKKLWCSMLCGGALAALLCTPALAAEEGDFSLVVN